MGTTEIDIPKKTRIASKYLAIADQIRTEVKQGRLLGALPGVKQLEKQFGANFMTINKALKLLEDENVVYRIPRVGTFIREKKTIALLSLVEPHTLRSYIYSDLIQHVEESSHKHNFTLIFQQVNDIKDITENGLIDRVDGFILFGPSDEVVKKCKWQKPIVRIMGQVNKSDKSHDHISYDNSALGRIAARYFLEKGHKSAAYISNNGRPLMQNRAQGFKEELLAAGAEFFQYEAPMDYSCQSIVIQMKQFFETDPMPKAIFCPADSHAIPIYTCLYSQGLQPGKDVEVIACNNEIEILKHLNPPPASVRIHLDKIAEEAMKCLLFRLANPKTKNSCKIALEPTLVLPGDFT